MLARFRKVVSVLVPTVTTDLQPGENRNFVNTPPPPRNCLWSDRFVSCSVLFGSQPVPSHIALQMTLLHERSTASASVSLSESSLFDKCSCRFDIDVALVIKGSGNSSAKHLGNQSCSCCNFLSAAIFIRKTYTLRIFPCSHHSADQTS